MAIEEQIRTMPVVALKGLTILPGMMTHFDAVKRQDIAAVEYALVGDQKVFLVTQRNPEPEEPELEDLYQVGTIALVKQLVRLPGKVVRVLVEGLERGELLTLEGGDRSLRGQVAPMDPGEEPDAVTQEAMCRIVKEKLEDYGRENLKFAKEILPGLRAITGLRELLNQTAIQMPWDYTIRQEILESVPLELRYEVVLKTILSEIEIYRIKREFQEKVKADIDQNQKEYILREQMKVIRQELGEENTVSEAEEYQKKVSQLKADRETKDKLMKEIGAFQDDAARKPGGKCTQNLYRNSAGASLEEGLQGQRRLKTRPGGTGCGSLRPGSGKGENPGISGGADPDQKGHQPHRMPGGTARNRQDLHRPVSGQSSEQEICAHQPGRNPG